MGKTALCKKSTNKKTNCVLIKKVQVPKPSRKVNKQKKRIVKNLESEDSELLNFQVRSVVESRLELDLYNESLSKGCQYSENFSESKQIGSASKRTWENTSSDDSEDPGDAKIEPTPWNASCRPGILYSDVVLGVQNKKTPDNEKIMTASDVALVNQRTELNVVKASSSFVLKQTTVPDLDAKVVSVDSFPVLSEMNKQKKEYQQKEQSNGCVVNSVSYATVLASAAPPTERVKPPLRFGIRSKIVRDSKFDRLVPMKAKVQELSKTKPETLNTADEIHDESGSTLTEKNEQPQVEDTTDQPNDKDKEEVNTFPKFTDSISYLKYHFCRLELLRMEANKTKVEEPIKKIPEPEVPEHTSFPKLVCHFEDSHYLRCEQSALLALRDSLKDNGQIEDNDNWES